MGRICRDRALVSGHGRLSEDGRLARSLGKVDAEVTPEQAHDAARLTALAVLASLEGALGGLDRVECWQSGFGMVNTAPGSTAYPAVINGFTDLIVQLYGRECGAHARSAIGVAGLPFDMPVEIEAEVAIRD